ncbi:hypothetical protein KP509_37G028500 [Ceratopteris richardii]|uniref:C2H2-type domain-containing protein n=2 Tax=Ceratopteris richardii TaxID=49495 RepID=A0A8T2Q7L2_CERRI|nr:hypothetical protein KP509_37G028500 [Ceratopteris richardii]
MASIKCRHPSCRATFPSMAMMLQHYTEDSHSSLTQGSTTSDHHTCDKCARFFYSLDALKNHLRSFHLLDYDDLPKVHEVSTALTYEQICSIKDVACNDCGKTFKDMDALHQHQWASSKHVKVSAMQNPNRGTARRQCSQCYSWHASAADLEQHFVETHPLIELKPGDHDYAKWEDVESRFKAAWIKPEIQLHKVCRIFKVYNPGWRRQRFESHRKELKRQMSEPSMVKNMRKELELKNDISNDGNELRRYHGTTVKCRLGRTVQRGKAQDTDDTCRLCTESTCSLCRIIETGFMTNKCRLERYQRYGKGIYTSQCSSKASEYVRYNASVRETGGFLACLSAVCLSDEISFSSSGKNTYKVMLICKVLAGRPYKTTGKDKHRRQAPKGYHSVQGIPGEDLNYDELVVYDDDAIIPDYIILYTSSG